MKKYAIVSTSVLKNEILNASLASTFSNFRQNNDATKMVVPIDKDNASYLSNFKHYSQAEILVEMAKTEWQSFDSGFTDKNYDQDAKDAVHTAGITEEGQVNPKTHEEVELAEKTPGGTSLLAIKKADGISFTRVSHDFTDPCTFYTQSVSVTDEVLTGSGVGPYDSANENWIDVENGRLFQEYLLDQYVVVVKIDDVVQTEGYTVDYENGQVTFASSTSGVVKASYYYENGADFILEPDAGKILGLEHSEIQFAKNADLTAPVNFEIWVYNPLFDTGQSPVAEDPTWFPGKPSEPFRNQLRFLYKFEKYKNIKDIINSANLGQGYIPAIGGLTEDILVFPFNYVTEIKLIHSQGAQMRITIDGDQPFTGEWATVTFYCTSESE